MRRTALLVAAASAALLLAGCSAPAAAPTPTRTVNPNAAACRSVQSATEGMADSLNDASSM
jgi:hypothetical protein